MRRQAVWAVLGLGLTVGACGHSTRTPTPAPIITDGGCASDCEAGGTSPTAGSPAGGTPAVGFISGGSAQAGTFSMGDPNSPSAAPPVQITCEPYNLICFGGDVYKCDGEGMSARLTQNCGPISHCQTIYPVISECVVDMCTPLTAECDGNVAKTCRADGTFPPTGTKCGALACDHGTCQPKICEPRTTFCHDGDIHLCIDQGATSQLAASCTTGSTCRGEPPHLECQPLACVPGTTGCIGNQVGPCDADGSALTQVDQDCAATGKVCDGAKACSPNAVDDIGGTTNTEQNTYAGNMIAVYSRRHLDKLEVNVRPAASDIAVHWAVTRMLPLGTGEAVAVADTVAHPGDTTASTTALNCDLEAGERYELVASFDTPASVDFEVSHALPIASFGTVSWIADNHAQQIYAMRVTTTLP